MTYLFDTPSVLDVNVSTGSANAEDEVLLSPSIWDYLIDDPSSPPRVLLSVARLQPSQESTNDGTVSESEVMKWCRPDRTVCWGQRWSVPLVDVRWY